MSCVRPETSWYIASNRQAPDASTDSSRRAWIQVVATKNIILVTLLPSAFRETGGVAGNLVGLAVWGHTFHAG
jgi:hypothetical protein